MQVLPPVKGICFMWIQYFNRIVFKDLKPQFVREEMTAKTC